MATEIEVQPARDRGLRRVLDWFDHSHRAHRPERRPSGDAGWIRVEEEIQGDHLKIRAEVPGIDPSKDAEIRLEDDVLTIEVKREERKRHEDKRGYRSEFRYGAFYRAVAVPPGVEPAQVKATYKDGILEVDVPIPTPTGPPPMKIPVQRVET